MKLGGWAGQVGDRVLFTEFAGMDSERDEGITITARAIPVSGGAATTLWTTHDERLNGMAKSYRAMRCRSESRCLVGERRDDELRFSWFDLESGEQTASPVVVPVADGKATWDLSFDESTVAVGVSGPSRVVLVDAETGNRGLERKVEALEPSSVAWAPDGKSLYLSILADDARRPYQVVEVEVEGGTTKLWSSMSQFAVLLNPAPDGEKLAAGVHTFGGDLYLLDGVGWTR